MSSLLLNLLFPPRCAGCDELIPVAEWRRGEECLCRECRAVWELAKLAKCTECGEAMVDCRCMPKLLEESGMQTLRRLVAYGREEDQRSVVDRLLYHVKDRHVIAYERFLAAQLAPLVNEEMYHRGWFLKKPDGSALFETVVAYCPRSRGKIAQAGTDQSARIARHLAKLLEVPYAPLLARRDNIEQKTLNGAQRQAHAVQSYRLKRGASVRVKRVILVDDIVTTGATMAACTRVLLDGGALSVLGVTAAQVNRKKEKKSKKT